MSRQIRRVPASWQHPEQINQYSNKKEYRSLMQWDYKEELKEFYEELEVYYKEYEEFEDGEIFWEWEEYETSKEKWTTYEDWAWKPPTPPNPYDYMPTGEWYQLFQTVSEWTPLSPPFETQKELIKWLTNNKDFWGTQWSPEWAKHIVESWFAMSGIFTGWKLYRPEDQHLLK